jgi:uncharacterized protein involved in cysteine biosynthesis
MVLEIIRNMVLALVMAYLVSHVAGAIVAALLGPLSCSGLGSR